MILHMGVIEGPHPSEDGVVKTTQDVADELEKNYGIFEHFASWDEAKIAEYLETGYVKVFEGRSTNPFKDMNENIGKDFRTFLDMEFMADMGVHGVPTKAALMGARLSVGGPQKWIKKSGKNMPITRSYGSRRPSFIDSGVFRASFKAWTE